MPRRGFLAFASLPLLTLVLGACQVGERPSFSSDPLVPGAMTGDSAVDTVLTKFDNVTTGPATASYTILRKYDPQEFSAVVVLSGSRRSVTVGNVRFLRTQSTTETCRLDGSAPCVDGVDQAAISDTGVTADFYAADAAKRLRRDTQAMVGPSVLHEETLVQQHATCVDIPLASGTASYCALDNGLVALLDDGDVLVSLTLFAATADEAAFTIS